MDSQRENNSMEGTYVPGFYTVHENYKNFRQIILGPTTEIVLLGEHKKSF